MYSYFSVFKIRSYLYPHLVYLLIFCEFSLSAEEVTPAAVSLDILEQLLDQRIAASISLLEQYNPHILERLLRIQRNNQTTPGIVQRGLYSIRPRSKGHTVETWSFR